MLFNASDSFLIINLKIILVFPMCIHFIEHWLKPKTKYIGTMLEVCCFTCVVKNYLLIINYNVT